MPLTSKYPEWSSICQEASIPAGNVAKLVLPQLNATSHPCTCIPLQMLSAAQAGLPGPLLSWLNMLQQHLLAKKESHTKLRRERLQYNHNLSLPHPKMWRAKCQSASFWPQTLHPQQPAGVAHTATPFLNELVEHPDPALPTACLHLCGESVLPAAAPVHTLWVSIQLLLEGVSLAGWPCSAHATLPGWKDSTQWPPPLVPPSLPTLSCNHSISCGPGQALCSLACEHTSKHHQKSHVASGWQVCKRLGILQESPEKPYVYLCRTEIALKQREWWGISRRRSHGEGRETCRGWNVFNPDAQAPGTVASSNNSPLTVLAESLQPPKMGTFFHAQACTSEGCKSAKTVLCKDAGVMGPNPSIFLVVQAWSLPTNNPPASENKT